jgi:hypothetical protein
MSHWCHTDNRRKSDIAKGESKRKTEEELLNLARCYSLETSANTDVLTECQQQNGVRVGRVRNSLNGENVLEFHSEATLGTKVLICQYNLL